MNKPLRWKSLVLAAGSVAATGALCGFNRTTETSEPVPLLIVTQCQPQRCAQRSTVQRFAEGAQLEFVDGTTSESCFQVLLQQPMRALHSMETSLSSRANKQVLCIYFHEYPANVEMLLHKLGTRLRQYFQTPGSKKHTLPKEKMPSTNLVEP